MVDKRELFLLFFFTIALLLGVLLLFQYTEGLLSQAVERGLALTTFTFEGKEDSLHYRPITPGEEGIYRFTSTLYTQDLPPSLADGGLLFVYRLAGQWYRIYWNNILIGTMGNLENGDSNIWNSFASFAVDKNLFQEKNRITIEIYGTFELGWLAFPVLFLDTKGATGLNSWLYFVLNRLHHVALGFMCSAFLLLIFIQLLSRRIQGEYLCYSLAAFFMCIASFDYLTFHQLSMPLFSFKRLILFSLYLAVFFLSLGIGLQFQRKMNRILGSIALISILLLILFSPNLHVFRQGFSLLNGLILLNILGWIYTSFVFFKKDEKARILFFSSLILLILSAYDSYYVFSTAYSLFSLTVIGSLIFSIIIILLVVFYYLELQKQMAHESQRAALMYQKSVRDSMTGIYNHQFIVNTLKDQLGLYSFLILDVDDFKDINDTYGHQVGDAVIKAVANRGTETIRKTDLMGRYGGDEFVVVLLGCTGEDALKIAENLKESIERPLSLQDGRAIPISISMGLYTRREGEKEELVLQRADKALYQAKKSGKGRILTYDSLRQNKEQLPE